MALVKSKLKSELETWMNNPSDNVNDAINAFVTAYENYAKSAIATSGGSLVSYPGKTNTITSLLTIPSIGTPLSSATLFATALSLFWVEATLTPSTVTTTFVPATLISALLPTFSNIDPNTTVSQYATDLSTAIHTATLTVITYNSGAVTSGTLG